MNETPELDHGRPGNCVHCGRRLTLKIGYANVAGGVVCHPRIPDGPDCYRLIVTYGEERGARLPAAPQTDLEWLEAEKEDYRLRLKACDQAVAERNGQILELEGKLEEMTRLRDNAIRQLNREDTPVSIDTYDLIHQGLDEVVDEWEGGDEFAERLVSAVAAKLHPDIARVEEARRRAEYKVQELADEGANLLKEIATIKGHYQRRTETLEAARDRNKKLLDAVVNEVFTVADSHRPADKRSPDYLYSLGRLEGFSQVRFAVLRGLGCFDPNHEVWIPFSRVEDVDLIRLAINDPGAFTEREKVHDGEYESLGQWGARAVLVALHEGRGDR